jgi:hypothetical protein
MRATGVAVLQDGTEVPTRWTKDGWEPVPGAVRYELVEAWDERQALETLAIDKAQAETLAARATSKIDKAYYAGYALAMGHALAVLERGLGPALVTDDTVRAAAVAKVRRGGQALE